MNRISARQQAGATLIICLIVLLVASTLAIYGARTSQSDMRLSVNQQDRSIALHRGDNAVREAEEFLESFDDLDSILAQIAAAPPPNINTQISQNGFINTLFPPLDPDNPADQWVMTDIWNKVRVLAGQNLPGSFYAIEYTGDFSPQQGLGAADGYPQHVYIFTTTNSGTGTGNSRVMLESTYNIMKNL